MTGEGRETETPAACLRGEPLLMRPGPAGVRRLSDLHGRDPRDLMRQINLAGGCPIWRAPIAVRAPRKPAGAARREGSRSPGQRRTAGG
jgi:hypothetical protein